MAPKMAKLALQMAKLAPRMAKLAQAGRPKCTQKRQLAKIAKTLIFHWFSLVFPGLEGLGGTWETLWGRLGEPWGRLGRPWGHLEAQGGLGKP